MINRNGSFVVFAGIFSILTVGFVIKGQQRTADAQDELILQDPKAKYSYAVGLQWGNNLKGQSLLLDAELVSRGLKDALTGAKSLLTEAEMKAALDVLRADFQMKQVEALKQVGEKNKKEGEAFLADNKTKEGVITLKSGLQYKILKAGDGKKPKADDTIVSHYRGTVLDGTEFSSSSANQPLTFSLKHLIAGWREALQLMPVGSKWQLFIPPSLAYGESGLRGAGASRIGPNATLIYEVELLAIRDTAPDGAPATADQGVSALAVSFKLDPRLTKGLYMGERWVSPPTYTTTLDTVEAKVARVGSNGRVENISAKWIPSDTEMVTVSPSEGNEVKITVKRPGETTLHVTSDGVTKELSLKAALQNDVMQVEITPRP